MTTLPLRSLRSLRTSTSSSCSPFYTQTPLLFSSASLLRHASTAISPPTTKVHHARLSSTVNGPASTLPAKLELPTRGKDEPFFFKYAFKLGKSYANFYKTGVKSIYANFKAARPIQARVDDKCKGSLAKAVEERVVDRKDFQLLVRNWHDVKRVPIFALVFLICGEFTPLVVIALTNVVPWTCRIPKQVESDRKKLEERRKTSFRNLVAPPPDERGVEKLQRSQLLHISWSLGLSSSLWDWLGGQYPGLPNSILRKKVSSRVEYLDMDDRLIGKPENVKDMNVEEVRMALVERGVDVLGRENKSLRADLASWLRSREKMPVERLLLTRPSVWPVKHSQDN